MTILIKGTLNMNARGIAMLHCDIGHFLVEHASLNNVASGKHTGFFEIQKIQPQVTNSSAGQFQVILHATLKQLVLQETTKAISVDVTEVKPKPYQQTLLFVDRDTALASDEVMPEALDDSEIAIEDKSIADLSSALAITLDNEAVTDEVEKVVSSEDVSPLPVALLPNWSMPLPEEVELDTTLPREQLREKTQALKAAGYRFDSTRQVWQRAA